MHNTPKQLGYKKFLLFHYETGETTIADWSLKRSIEEEIEEHKRLGRFFGFPKCCINEFCEDQRHGRVSGTLRGHRLINNNPGRVYVPCSKCLQREEQR